MLGGSRVANVRNYAAGVVTSDTLIIYKPDRIARSMKELLVLFEGEAHLF